jgi:hypothetical protein
LAQEFSDPEDAGNASGPIDQTRRSVVDMTEPTRVPPGEQDWTPQLLALAIVEAEIRGNWDDLRSLIDAAMAEDPRGVIECLANVFGVELADTYGPHALCQTDAIRWAWIGPREGA